MTIKTDRSILSQLKASSVRLMAGHVVPITTEDDGGDWNDAQGVCNRSCHINKEGLLVFEVVKPFGRPNPQEQWGWTM